MTFLTPVSNGEWMYCRETFTDRKEALSFMEQLFPFKKGVCLKRVGDRWVVLVWEDKVEYLVKFSEIRKFIGR